MRALSLAVVLLAATLLPACGGDDDGADAAPPDALVPDASTVDVLFADAPPACHTCNDILMGNGDPPLCEGSEALFTTLNTCICAGACMDECGANVCMNMAPDTTCTNCIQDTAAGCGNDYAACAMD